jgi:hypothetical protein
MANSRRLDPYKNFKFRVLAAAVAGVAGFAIARTLASNKRSNVDNAFRRRLRFIAGSEAPPADNKSGLASPRTSGRSKRPSRG